MDGKSNEEKGQAVNVSVVNDLPSSKDFLGFTPYVQAIADFLTSEDTKPPLTLSIQGEWGSGKSSFMLQLQAALRTRGRHLIVWFNPWRHDKEDAVWAAFALQFLHDVKKQLWFWRRWIGNLRLLIRRFRWEQGWLDLVRKLFLWLFVFGITAFVGYVAYDNGTVWTKNLGTTVTTLLGISGQKELITTGIETGGVTAYIAFLLLLLSRLESIVGDPLKIDLKRYVDTPNYAERVSFVERFHRDFKHIVEAYAGQEAVFVFIDDVDRVDVPKASELMSALNLMISNDIRIFFIIGMDPEKVAASLAVKYEKLLPYLFVHRKEGEDEHVAGLDYGYDFIKKFVQLSFLLPRPDDEALDEFLKRISGAPEKRNTWDKWLVMIRSWFQPRLPLTTVNLLNAPYIHDIAKKIAPTFENNPRHIKQFINLLRLQLYIADKTGLFQAEHGERPLTPQQYSKFIAISLQWPLLISELDTQTNLLASLQKLALHTDDKNLNITPSAASEFWRQRSDLMEFLTLGCRDEQGSLTPENEALWSLEYVDTAELLKTSTQILKAPLVEEKVMMETAEQDISSSVRISTGVPSSIKLRVYSIILNPFDVHKKKSLLTANNWQNPSELAEKLSQSLREVSNGLVDVEIVKRDELREWPALTDGFRYDWEQFSDVLTGKSKSHTPYELDYRDLLKKFDIPNLVSQNQIDEVWVFGFPYSGLYQSIMTGTGAFWCNAPPLKFPIRRRFIIMGFSCDRGVGEMLEAYGHRAESIMAKTFEAKRGKNNLWQKFTQYDIVHPGQANIGTIHFAPNSEKDYDWGNPRKVPSNCYDWLNFPDFKGDIREVNASEWGNGDIEKHHLWWFQHLPHTGGDAGGISNNWWEYICNPNNVKN